MIQKNALVTVDLDNKNSSNTFIVDTVEENSVILTHPLLNGVLLRVSREKVDTTSANIKDSIERAIDFANSNKTYLDYSSILDLESVAIFYIVKRKSTPRQKQTLANICGLIAKAKFNDDLKPAMSYVAKNKSVLDDFNTMWFNNFQGLFTGVQLVTSPKQRSAIFNIAGYAMAEMENPTANRRK